MKVELLQLNDFRNYKNCFVELNPGFNIFVGQNAQGKTNLLESLVFMSTTRSHRTNNDEDMIHTEGDMSSVAIRLNDEQTLIELRGIISKEGKHLFIRKQPVRKTSEFIGKLNAVLFSPTDFEMLSGSPKLRRRFMDMEIGKVEPNYMRLLSLYQKILKERNAHLKGNIIDETYIDIQTEQLAKLSLQISKYRRQFISMMNNYLPDNYKTISKESYPIEMRYFSIVEEEDNEKSLLLKYEKYKERDRILHQTSIGIHKDDFSFWMRNREVNSFASQGQKRMIILSLKAALIGYIRLLTHKDAVLLLDDVLSELDEEKQRNLLQLIPQGIQTIITTTSIQDLINVLPKSTKIFEIDNGTIRSIKEVTQ